MKSKFVIFLLGTLFIFGASSCKTKEGCNYDVHNQMAQNGNIGETDGKKKAKKSKTRSGLLSPKQKKRR